MSNELNEIKITSEYHGPEVCEGRFLWEYAQEVRNGTNQDIYEKIIQAVQRAKDAGRKMCVILDVGCGSEWNVGQTLSPDTRESVLSLKSTLTDHEETEHEKESLTKIDKLLEELDMQLVVVGLTDAKTGQQDMVLWSTDSQRYSVRKIAYTLAPSQTIRDFLKNHIKESGGTVDLALAIQSLEYLKPEVYQETVPAVAISLNQGGEFIAVGIGPDYKVQETGGLAPKYDSPEIKQRKEFVKQLPGSFNVTVLSKGKDEYTKNLHDSFVIQRG